MFKESQQLMQVVNDFKDKNIDLEIKYVDLMLEQDTLNEEQTAELMNKKKAVIDGRNKILLPHLSVQKRKNLIDHELALEGEILI